MILTLSLFAQLSASCAPSVAVETLAAVARTESRLNTLAIYDNTTHRSLRPETTEAAVATATDLLRQGHSLDLGLLQINSGNLGWLSLSIADAFEPCRSLAAGARVLTAGYGGGDTEDARQQALLISLSRYNTGNPQSGFANGYVARVQASADVVVPAIRTHSDTGPVAQPSAPTVLVQPLPPRPAAWDVYGQARTERAQRVGVYSPNRGDNHPHTPGDPTP